VESLYENCELENGNKRLNILQEESVKEILRKELHITANDFVFIFVGRIVNDKGMKELSKAMQSLLKKNYHLTPKLLLVGDFESKLDPLSPEDENFFKDRAIHLHFPEGATPKDGPSAGITITTAIVSVLTNRKVRQDIAMTGEITITGDVLAIGGVREKVIGAHRAGIKEVILPEDNRVDTDEIPDELKSTMKIHFAKTYDDVSKLVFVK